MPKPDRITLVVKAVREIGNLSDTFAIRTHASKDCKTTS